MPGERFHAFAIALIFGPPAFGAAIAIAHRNGPVALLFVLGMPVLAVGYTLVHAARTEAPGE